jgi:fatty-acid peroxygenase
MAELRQDAAETTTGATLPGRAPRGLRSRLAARGVVLSRPALLGRPLADSAPALLTSGYAWLPDRRGRGALARVRLFGQRAVGIAGPDAVAFFYDESHVRRHTAVPGPVQSTLFGHGTVHTLDGPEHRRRKAMFLGLMTAEGVADLVARTVECWDETAATWPGRGPVVLFDEASRVVARAVCDWAGVRVEADDVPELAADLVSLVDGFGNGARRQWRARRVRDRREAWLTGVVAAVRAGTTAAPPGSALDAVAWHQDVDGRLLDDRTAAVELLNVLRPTVAVCWFVAYAGHALHRWPACRDRLRDGDPAFAEAFAHELRRFYPFAPFVGARAVRDLSWRGATIPRDSLVLLDLYGQNHDHALWGDPYSFRPERFLDRPPRADDLVPQGGGDPHTGHRCPGEGLTVALLTALVPRLAALDVTLPGQDLTIPLGRLPARPRSGVVIQVGSPGATPGRR